MVFLVTGKKEEGEEIFFEGVYVPGIELVF